MTPTKPKRRRLIGRRKRDLYFTIGRFAGLFGFPSLAIYGQAELVGEPWRHVIGVTGIIGVVILAYGTQPDFLSRHWASWRSCGS